MLGDQMPGALERRSVDPTNFEAERFELRTKHIGHGADAREVHRAAVDVHDPLEQRQRLGVVRIDRTSRRALNGG